jgi:hypothetical protein
MRGEVPPPGRQPGSRFGGARNVLAQLVFGMMGYEFAQSALAARVAMENLFMVVVVGDMIGIPVMPPYYSLSLLPYVVPEITAWKRRVLREREFSDEHEFHLHGV